MTTINARERDGKMKNSEKEALQKEISFYSNLLAEHAKLLKTRATVKPVTLTNNTHTSNNKNEKIYKTSKHELLYNSRPKFVSKNITNEVAKSSLPYSSGFYNRTVVLNKNLVAKAPVPSQNKLHADPFNKKTVSSCMSFQKPFGNFSNNTSSFNKLMHFKKSSQSPSRQTSYYQKLSKDNYTTSFVTKKNMPTKGVWKDDKEPPSKKFCQKSSNPQLLIGEILAITQKLKQTSETLSSSRTSSVSSVSSGKLIGISDATCNQGLKSTAKPIFTCTKKGDNQTVKDTPKDVNNTLSIPLKAISASRSLLDKGNSVQSTAVSNISFVKNPNYISFSDKVKYEDISSALATEQKIQNLHVQNYKLSSFLKKQLEKNYGISKKPQKELSSKPSCTPTRNTANAFCTITKKKNAIIKLPASKYQVVNKYSPFNQAMTFGISCESNLNVCKSQHENLKWTSQKELSAFMGKQKQLNAKYKVPNKILDGATLKNNDHLKFSSIKNLKCDKLTPLKKMKSSEDLNKNATSKTLLLPMQRKPQLNISKPSTKFYSKTDRTLGSSKKIAKSPLPSKRQRLISLKSAAKSKYKVIHKPSISLISTTQNRARKFKLDSKKVCSLLKSEVDVDLLLELAAEKKHKDSNKVCSPLKSDIDIDLLLELAAEKKYKNPDIKKAPIPDKRVLIKRMFKSKNVIVNKNVHSAQIKTAKMIKSKYFTVNKKHSWQKQATSNRFLNNKRFQGGSYKSFQNKNVMQFYHQKLRRNHFNHRNTHYSGTSSALKRKSKRLLHHPSMYTLGSKHVSKYFRRIAANRKLARANAIKQSTPVSKVLASRVLQHSINRVLTASLKKKMSKVNTYCMFYNRFGRCNKGTKCPYVHDPSKIAICTRFLRGTCKVENCCFSHEICPGKMAICSFYLTGSCTKTDCPYRHEMLSPNSDLCKAFVKGYCSKGKQCKKAHVLVCPQYVQGFCSKGDECAFPHPPPKENKTYTKTTEKSEPPSDIDEFLMEKVSRYFQPISEKSKETSNSVVPKRKNLPEQPSFISLSSNDS